MRRLVAAIVMASGLVIAAPAQAGWLTPEPAPSGVSRVHLAPGGTGMAIGFYASGPSRARLALRPLAGTLGDPVELPGTSGTITANDPYPTFDAAGNAIIANEATRHVAYRSADGSMETDQVLNADAQNHPKLVSVDPATGTALIGIQGSNPTGIIRVLYRAPGPGTTAVDEAAKVDLDTGSELLGLQLQSDGGAIVVWRKGDDLWQSVRQPGAGALFSAPSQISTPGDPRKTTIVFDSDPSGWAMLSWYGSTTTDSVSRSDRAVATVRPPNGSFGAAQDVGTSPVVGGVVNATPTITSKGQGMVTWRHTSAGACSPGTVMATRYVNGSWTAPAPLAGDAYPEISIPAWFAASSGDHIVVPVTRIHDVKNTPCNYNDDQRDIVFRHFTGTASGLTDDGTSELVVGGLRSDQTTPRQVVMNDLAIEPGGRLLAAYGVDSDRFLRSFDGVVPGPGGGGGDQTPTPQPPAPSPPAPTPPGPSPLPPPPLPKLVLQQFVRVAPVDPATLSVGFTCIATPDELCGVDYYFYYRFTGRVPTPSGSARAAAKARTILLARGKGKAAGGKSIKVRMKPTKLGKRFLGLHRKLKITLEARVSVSDGRKTTGRFKTTIKAPKRKKR